MSHLIVWEALKRPDHPLEAETCLITHSRTDSPTSLQWVLKIVDLESLQEIILMLAVDLATDLTLLKVFKLQAIECDLDKIIASLLTVQTTQPRTSIEQVAVAKDKALVNLEQAIDSIARQGA